jgi:phospholipid/cholesterol/gamma-HCH transport system permease protein
MFAASHQSAPVQVSRLFRWIDRLGFRVLRVIAATRNLIVFGMVIMEAVATHAGTGTRVLRPLMRREVRRAGWRLLPAAGLLALGLGLVVIGQTIALLNRVGAQEYLGTIMITTVVRELGPLVVALLVLARAGTVHVVELGTARVLGELEALESLRIDPLRYLVLPRITGMAIATVSLSIWFLLIALAGGFAFAFIQNVALTPEEYLRQLTAALHWHDFPLLVLKASCFGAVLAIVSCYHGILSLRRLEELPTATTRAVVQSIVACLVVDLFFLIIHLQLG